MIVRKAKEQDIDAIIKLLDELETAHLGLNLSETERKFMQKSQDAHKIIKDGLEKSLKKDTGCLLVAEENGNAVGYLKAEIDVRSPTKLHNKKLYIRHLIVSNDYRNRGVGRKLLEKAEAFAKENKIQFITLKTSPKNKSSTDFYKSLGFEDIYIEKIKNVKL